MRAISLFLLVIAAWAQSPSSSVTKGIDDFHHGRYAEARNILEKSPGDENARVFLALTRAALGSCKQAEPELDHQFAVNSQPSLRRLAGLALIQCRLSENNLAGAFPVLTELQKSFPGDADVLYEAAKVYRKAWNDTVYEMYRKTPASFRVNQLSAEIFEIQSQYPQAVSEYRKAIQKSPAALDLHFHLGRALLLESHDPKNLEEARREFEAELKLNPSDAAAEYEIGQISVAQQDAVGADAHFEKAISLNPDFPEALAALGRLRLDAKRYGDAIRLLEQAVKQRPAMESAHYSLMLAYRNAGRAEDARREKEILDKLQRPPDGEFTEFLKKLGEKAPQP